MASTIRDGAAAGLFAGVVSGAPSTVYAWATGTDPLEATYAAGSILFPRSDRKEHLAAAALPLHLGLSAGWGVVLAALLPRRATAAWGAVAGGAIAALDLSVGRRRWPRIERLPLLPQLADHLAFGLAAGAFLQRARGQA